MKEIKLTDRIDITFNSLLIFSVPQLSGGSCDDQISEEGVSASITTGHFFFLFSAIDKSNRHTGASPHSVEVEFLLGDERRLACGGAVCRVTTQQMKITSSSR